MAVGKVTRLQRQRASSDGVWPPEILDAGVVFTRVIDETPVVGPGAHETNGVGVNFQPLLSRLAEEGEPYVYL